MFLDSRFLVPHIVPLRTRGIHLLYQMHNMHLEPPRRWDSGMSPVYRRVLERIDGMDAIVNLTERQSDDIAARRGRTTNMFVVPNPVDVPPLPDPLPERDPHLVVTMARLETQKRLMHAISAFGRVVEAVPEARLDIYGEGSQRDKLQTAIERSGLTGSVTLRGYDPHAREALWTRERVPDDERLRGLPAVDARGHEPGLSRGQLRHPLRAARADRRRRRRLRRPRGRRGRARRARGRAAALARARAAHERGGAREGLRASGRPSSWSAGRR